jgi:mycothiol synthase
MSSSPLRELREDDAPAVAALFAAAFGEARSIDAEEIRSWLHNEELRSEWLRVLEHDGRVVGYGDIWVQDEELAVDVAAPGCWDVFLDWAQEQARADGSGRVRVFLPAGHELEELVSTRGYRPARSSFTMEVGLVGPEQIAGIELIAFRTTDAEAVRHALNEAFADDPNHHHVSSANFREFFLKARGFESSLWTLAWDGRELAGFALAYSERGGDTTLGWVGTLGVRREWRRRGLGAALLETAFLTLYERGLRRVGLGVDAENETGALRLYERAGMQIVHRSNTWVLTS